MEMLPIEGSSFIAKIGYDLATKKMRIEFTNGTLSESEGPPVEAQDYEAFLASESKGKYWHKHIKGKYTFIRVEEE